MACSTNSAKFITAADCYGLYLENDVPQWSILSPYPRVANRFALVEVGTQIYGIGGVEAGQNIDSIYNFNIQTDIWTHFDTMPEPISAFGTVVFQDEVWIIGGAT